MDTKTILNNEDFSSETLVHLLGVTGADADLLFDKAKQVKEKEVGNVVYFRGLIEYANKCSKDCYYCGIRCGNKALARYTLTTDEVLEAARYAYDNNFASIVIQSGERSDKAFVNTITEILNRIKEMSGGKLGITLSLGEQSNAVYRAWYEAGAHRYLLRIETSDRELYKKLHPNNSKHSFDKRIEALEALRAEGYQVGSGVMIGLPFQTTEHLAADLRFLKSFDIDMCGMGPYVEHEATPLFKYSSELIPRKERFNLTLKMIALLRIMMKDINIAATTAMQAIDPMGREKALMAGANIIMPNLTPVKYRENYKLYEDKPCMDEEADECKNCLEARIRLTNHKIGYGEWGDSKHFSSKISKG